MKPGSSGRDIASTWLCAGAVLLAIALTFPVAEMGVNDDWSYAKTALDLANSGHLLYNGWSAAMLGAQAYWGALFIKLFGFSFFIVRLSVAPLAAGCAALLYRLHRRGGLTPGFSVFGTLAICLSPVFIPNAASFMTEIPALFLFLLSMFAYVRAAEILDGVLEKPEAAGGWRNRLWFWLALGSAAGVIGGTIRQIDWFVPVLAPALLLARRWTFLRLRPALFPLTVCALASLAGAFWFSAWFKDQPYAIQEKVGIAFQLLPTAEAPPFLCMMAAYLGQTFGALLWPVLLLLPALVVRWMGGGSDRVRRWSAWMGATVLIWFGAWLAYKREWVFPWLGNTFNLRPYLTGTMPAPQGSIPTTLPVEVWKAFGLTVTALACGSLALWALASIWPRRAAPAAADSGRIPPVLELFGIFTAAYIPLLLLKALVPNSFGLWDRYALPVLPLATIGFLRVYQRWTARERVPAAAWLGVVFFMYYGVAQAHDHFAQMRARLAVTDYLGSRGIPRNRILGGFEYDSWTQLMEAGHYNDSRILKPEGAYVPPPDSLGFETMYRLWVYTPVVRPDYIVATVRHPDLTTSDLPPQEYRCWLPPFQRRIWVQVKDPAKAVVRSLPDSIEPQRR
ncbi:MAG: hypothetical protein U1F98_17550 [Verrucomicrobiota bacterium]